MLDKTVINKIHPIFNSLQSDFAMKNVAKNHKEFENSAAHCDILDPKM